MSRLDALDQELARWQAAGAAILANVYELYEHPAYRVLAGDGLNHPPLALAGRSRERIGQGVATVGELLGLASELKNVIERAAKTRAGLPLLFRDERLAEIEFLLRGPSIKVPADGPIPLARRDLLAGAVDPAARAITPEQLLARMQPAFEAARDAVFAADRAWATLPAALDAAESEADGLERAAEPLGSHAPASARDDLATARRELAAAREMLRTDPFGAVETLETLALPRLNQARAGLETVRRQWQAAQSELAAARELGRQLGELHAQALAACAERRLKIAVQPSPPEPPDEGTVAALTRWLERLGATLERGGDWPSARIGIARWREQTTAALTAQRAALEAANSLLRERLSLRGLLDALRVKATHGGLSEDAELAALAREAREQLFARPTPLGQARELVTTYQNRLNARLARASRG